MLNRRHLLALSACAALALPAAHAADGMDPALRARYGLGGAGSRADAEGGGGGMGWLIRLLPLAILFLIKRPKLLIPLLLVGGVWYFLLGGQEMLSGGGGEGDGAFITNQVAFVLSKARPDGAISDSLQNLSYNTAVSMNALAATKNPKYADVIGRAQKFLIGHQIDEGEGYKPDHRYYGGIGYGGDDKSRRGQIKAARAPVRRDD